MFGEVVAEAHAPHLGLAEVVLAELSPALGGPPDNPLSGRKSHHDQHEIQDADHDGSDRRLAAEFSTV